MTQEELRAKRENYDLEGATLRQLISDRDFAREMYLRCVRMRSTVYDAIRNIILKCEEERPTREVDDATTELLEAIRFEEYEYFRHAEKLGHEINERLSKMDSNN